MPGGPRRRAGYGPGGRDERMMGVVYRQESGNWKLFELALGSYRIAGKSAPEWYREARELHAEGMMLPAILRMGIAGQFMFGVLPTEGGENINAFGLGLLFTATMN